MLVFGHRTGNGTLQNFVDHLRSSFKQFLNHERSLEYMVVALGFPRKPVARERRSQASLFTKAKISA
jgi:hypothetical protein